MIKSKLNNVILGIIIGLVIPLLTLYFVSQNRFPDKSFLEFYHYTSTMKVFSKIFSLTVLPNLLTFFIFIWLNKLLTARGILVSTVVLALMMVLFKYVI